jgi:hypothetical protein
VLKVTPEPLIARAEAAALRAWAATSHAVALLDADPGGGALLLERVRPGTKLWDAGARPPAREMAELLIGLRAGPGDLAHQPRIDELCGMVPGLDADRLWAWCRATAVIIVVQHLHNRPADVRIPFLLQLAAQA